jgi:hypothetical protein
VLLAEETGKIITKGLEKRPASPDQIRFSKYVRQGRLGETANLMAAG